MRQRVPWSGVFPAVTTQFREDLSLDVDATARVIEGLIRDGVSGLIVCGTVGENCSLAKNEKIAVMEAAKATARGRVPVLSGIAEFTSSFRASGSARWGGCPACRMQFRGKARRCSGWLARAGMTRR